MRAQLAVVATAALGSLTSGCGHESAASSGAVAPPAAAGEIASAETPRLVARDAFTGGFSPDGRQLAYARLPDNSGITILDLGSGATRSLVSPGKVPVWSPDGRRIAYVVGDSARGTEAEEVWVVGSDGTGARRLAEGASFPSWSSDGRAVVVHSRREGKMLNLPVDGPATPTVFYDGPLTPFPFVSPDTRLVAFGREHQLQVYDRLNKQQVFSWPTPGVSGLTAAWSPDQRRLAVGGNGGNPIGLWVIDVDRRKAVQVAVGHFFRPAWSRDGKRLVFDLREPRRKALWQMGRGFVDRCLESAGVSDSELGFGTGICPQALRTPASLR